MVSPTQRSIKHLKEDGWLPAVVERWNPHARIRQDLYRFADVIAIKSGHRPKLIQITSSGWASRFTKVTEEPFALLCLQSGFDIEVHGWRKLKTNRNRFTIKILSVEMKDMTPECHTKLSTTLASLAA